MKLKEVSSIVYDIKQKGYDIGLTIEDYDRLKTMLSSLDLHNVAIDQRWTDIYYEINGILTQIYESGLLHKFSKENCKFIKEHSSLLSLVLANNTHPEIRMYGNNSFMFLCQFHKEKTQSMGVSDIKNNLFCFGCGISADVIAYLEQYENINYKDAIQLLAQIYLYNVHSKDHSLDDIAKKYQETILSDSYTEVLKRGYERLKERKVDEINGINVDKYYKEKFKNIERIKNKEYDPKFKYIESPKVIRLTKNDRF